MSENKMKFTEEQEKVINVRENCVVVAGAGAGKTAVLSERYLALVDDLVKEGYSIGEAIESILTLTFTDKAAKEMKDRIYKKLKGEYKSFDFSKSNISTIDSFCMQVLKNSPNTLGLTNNFAPNETKVKEICSLSALEILEKYSESEVVKNLIKKNGFKNLWKSFLTNFASDYFYISEVWDFEKILNDRKIFIERTLENNFKELKQFWIYMDSQIDKKKDDNKLLNYIKPLSNFLKLEYFIEDDTLFDEFKNYTINKRTITDNNLVDKNKKDIIKEEVDDFYEKRNNMVSQIYFLKTFHLHLEFAKIMTEFQNLVIKKKQATGYLSFTDISKGAVSILQKNKKLRNFYKSKIRYIMVDEFQDNNALQRDLLYLIAEREDKTSDTIPTTENLSPDKLFFVGDEKQSIYKFRGADVSVFNNLKKDMSKTLTLTKNFRSDKTLMDKFNTLFTTIMGEEDQDSPDYEAKYTNIDATKNILNDKSEFIVAIKNKKGINAKEAVKSEFYYIVETIKDYIKSGKKVMKKDHQTGNLIRKPCTYEDFTILLKTTTNQNLLEEILKANNIPYKSEKMKTLFKEAIVNDILAVMKASIYNFDKVAIATVLRSPIINLSDAGFTKVLFEKNSYEKIEDLANSEDTEKEKYKNFIKITKTVEKMADNKNLSEIISYIWHETGYKYYIIGQEHLSQYEEFFSSFLCYANTYDQEKTSIVKFIEDTYMFIEEIDDEKAPDNISSLTEKKEGVRIMTVHKSKGLEFPITILANSNSDIKSKKENNNYFIYENKENPELDGPVFTIPDGSIKFSQEQTTKTGTISLNEMATLFYSEIKKLNQAKEIAELKRLFYVAVTRAESHFVMTGSLSENPKFSEKNMLNLYLGESTTPNFPDPDATSYTLIDPENQYTQEQIYNQKEAQQKENKLKNKIKQLANTSPAPKIPHLKNQGSPSTLNTKLNQEEYKASISENPDTKEKTEKAKTLPTYKIDEILNKEKNTEKLAAKFGTLCHLVIEKQIKQQKIQDQDLAAFKDNKKQVLEQAQKFASNFKELQELNQKYQLKAEHSFMYKLRHQDKNYYINATIDLYYETPDTVQIIDYKTDKQIVPGEYDLQMCLYRKILSQHTGKKAQSKLLYLRNGEYIESQKEFPDSQLKDLFN